MLYILYLCNVYSENGSSKVNFNLIADTECIQWKLFPSRLLVILYPDKAISVFVPTGFFWGAIFGLILQFSIIHEIHVHKSRVDLAGSDLWSFYQFTLLGVCVVLCTCTRTMSFMKKMVFLQHLMASVYFFTFCTSEFEQFLTLI